MTDVDLSTVQLVASLVAYSGEQTAHTLEALWASERHNALALAEGLTDLYEAVAALPDTVRTVALERALGRSYVAYVNACDGLDGHWVRLPGDESVGDPS